MEVGDRRAAVLALAMILTTIGFVFRSCNELDRRNCETVMQHGSQEQKILAQAAGGPCRASTR
jgi:hypothetical protein